MDRNQENTAMKFCKVLIMISIFLLFPGISRAEGDIQSVLDLQFTKVTLENGLTVLIKEDHKSPIVAVNIWYHVGSKNEPTGRNGFAHLFEHLMFQGSENFNDDYFQALEKIGATDLNGTTNEDRTNYFQNVPSTALDTALFMESDRMGHFVNSISQAKLTEQREVVLNEKRQSENKPYWGIAQELIAKGAYPVGHPYSWTTIGSYEDLRAATLPDVKQWFQTYYGPNNAVLTIVGDVKTDEALAKAKKYFGDIPPGPRIARMTEWIAKRTESKRQTVQDYVPYAKLLKIWNIPALTSPDFVVLDAASDILSLSKSSRLYKDIIYDQQLASDISASIMPNEIGSLFVIDATAKEGVSLEKLESAINVTMAKFLKDGPTSEELKKVNSRYEASTISSLEKIGGFGGQANLLASYETYFGDAGAFRKTISHRMNLKTTEIRDLSRKWLSSGDYNLEINPFPKFEPVASDVNRSKLPEPKSYPKATFPTLQKTTLSNGVNVILATRKHIPEVEMGIIIDAGYAKDPKDKLGTARLAFDLLDEGTKKHSLFDISDKLDLLGSSIDSFSGVNHGGLYAKSLVKNLDPTLDLVSEILLSPAFSQKEFDRIQKETLEDIQQEKADPSRVASRVFAQLVFGKDHPYGIPLSGTGYEKTISAISRKDIVDFYNTWAKPNNTTIVAVGDISISDLKNKLEKHLSSWSKKDLPAFAVPEVKTEKQQGKFFLIDKPRSPQTAIYTGHLFSPFNDPKEISNKLMNDVLGGSFTARINMNLRENKGWSYGAYSGALDLEGTRLWFTRAPVQIDKTDLAIKEIQNEIRAMASQSKPVSQAEFEKQRINAILELAGQWETNGSLYDPIRKLVFYNMDLNYYLTYPDKLQAATLAGVVESAKTNLHPDHLVWLLVGDKATILPQLAKQGIKPAIIDADGNPK